MAQKKATEASQKANEASQKANEASQKASQAAENANLANYRFLMNQAQNLHQQAQELASKDANISLLFFSYAIEGIRHERAPATSKDHSRRRLEEQKVTSSWANRQLRNGVMFTVSG